MARLLILLATLGWATSASADGTERTDDSRPSTRSVRLRLALGSGLHVSELRRRDDGFAQLEAAGQLAPIAFGQALAQLDVSLAEPLRVGLAGGASWRTTGGTSTLAPRGIENHWRYGYAEVLVILGKRRRLGRLTTDLGARMSIGGGRTAWSQGGERVDAPLVRASLAFEAAFLFRRGAGVSVRAGYALARSGSMGPAELYFDYSGLFVDAGFIMELAR